MPGKHDHDKWIGGDFHSNWLSLHQIWLWISDFWLTRYLSLYRKHDQGLILLISGEVTLRWCAYYRGDLPWSLILSAFARSLWSKTHASVYLYGDHCSECWSLSYMINVLCVLGNISLDHRSIMPLNPRKHDQGSFHDHAS